MSPLQPRCQGTEQAPKRTPGRQATCNRCQGKTPGAMWAYPGATPNSGCQTKTPAWLAGPSRRCRRGVRATNQRGPLRRLRPAAPRAAHVKRRAGPAHNRCASAPPQRCASHRGQGKRGARLRGPPETNSRAAATQVPTTRCPADGPRTPRAQGKHPASRPQVIPTEKRRHTPDAEQNAGRGSRRGSRQIRTARPGNVG